LKLANGLKVLLHKSNPFLFMSNAQMEPNLSRYHFQGCGKLAIKMIVTMSILIFLMAIKVTPLLLAVRITLGQKDLVCHQVNFQSLTTGIFVSSVTLLSHITQLLKCALMKKDARTKTSAALKLTRKKTIA
jgi:hypothetical protein